MKTSFQRLSLLRVLPVAIVLASASLGLLPAQAIAAADINSTPDMYSFSDDFESGNTDGWNYVGLWGKTSSVAVRYDSTARTKVLVATSEKATSRVGKAYITKDTIAMTRGDTVEVSTKVRIPKPGSGADSIYLLDLECRDCGYDDKPGIRVLVDKSGNLRVNRSKLGISQEFRAVAKVPYDRPFVLSLIMTLGQEEGTTQVFIDGTLVIDANGTNMPLAAVVAKYGVHLTGERFDYVQIGVTANSGLAARTAVFDDFRLDVMKQR